MVVETRNRVKDSPIKAPVTRKRSYVPVPGKKRVARNLLDKFNACDDSPPPSPGLDTHEDIHLTPTPIVNPIAEAKRLLSIGAVGGIMCRDREISELSDFLEECIIENESSTIFVIGPPGTGKSVSVISVVANLTCQYILTFLAYNSMDFSKSTKILSKIAGDLGIKVTKLHKLIVSIENYLTASVSMVILLIDEFDKLDRNLGDTLLDWSKAEKSKLILICISNTSPSSSSTMNRCRKISFRPHNKDQLCHIIQSRLRCISKTCDIISEPALNLCALKVSSYSGDARKALDICRLAIEMAEREKYSYPDDSNNIGSPRKSPRMSPKMSPSEEKFHKPLVEPRHIMSILASVPGTALLDERFAVLTLHQQVILCCILCYGRERKNNEIPVPILYKLFVKVCEKCKITSISINNCNFLFVCQILESLGLLKIKNGREMHLTKISLSVNENEISQRIADKSLMKNLLKLIPQVIANQTHVLMK